MIGIGSKCEATTNQAFTEGGDSKTRRCLLDGKQEQVHGGVRDAEAAGTY